MAEFTEAPTSNNQDHTTVFISDLLLTYLHTNNITSIQQTITNIQQPNSQYKFYTTNL